MQLFGPSAVTRAEALAQQAQAQATSGTGSNSGTSSSSAPTSLNSLTSENTFLQLLVAQIQNQDPLNPTDSIQFVGQLVQYSELEQLMGINQGVQTLTGSTSSTSTNATANATKQTSSS
jgi:flagellar basal-body rod modification protein FlgD